MTKRILSLILALLMVATLFAACGDEKRSSKKDKDEKDVVTTEAAPADPLQGSWYAEPDGVEMTFTFNGDGTGSVETMGMTMDTTYTVSGNTISLTMSFMGESETTEFEYSVSGNELSLTTDGETQVFTKKGTASKPSTNSGSVGGSVSSSDPLKGSWSAEQDGVEMTFTFNGDGTGSVETMGVSMDTTYTISGNTVELTMSFMGESETQELEYSINGNELTLTDGVDPIVFTKK